MTVIKQRNREMHDAARLSAPDLPPMLAVSLAMRAHGDRLFPEVAIDDSTARQLACAFDIGGGNGGIDPPSTYATLACTRLFREVAERYLEKFQEGHVVVLGCGLTDYAQWLDNGLVSITNADTAAVVGLRQKVLPDTCSRHVTRTVDLDSPTWWEDIRRSEEHLKGPLCVLCHWGRAFFFHPLSQRLLSTFAARAPAASVLAFDTMSCYASVSRSKLNPPPGCAEWPIKRGCSRPCEVNSLTRAHQRLDLRAVFDVMRDYPPFSTMAGSFFRAAFGRKFYAVYEFQTR